MQITYKDKVTLQSNPNIPDENKVTAKDMNEIKSVVNSNEEEQQALNMSVQEIAQNVVNNSQEISNIKEEQTTQNDNIQTNSNNISDLQSNKADKSEIPTDLSQLSNDNTKFVNETGLENAISQEKTQRQNADNNLQNQVDTNKTNIQTNATNIATNMQEINTIKAEQTTQNNRLNSLEVDNTTNKSDILTNKQEINNIKTEQTEQNTNISTNATNIESLQEENKKLKEQIDNYNKQLPQVPGQGTSITLENTIEAPFTIFDVEGNSTQAILPEEYQQVDYIESTGTQYIDTGYTPVQGDNFEIKNVTTKSNGMIFYSGTGENQLGIFVFDNDGYYKYFATGAASHFLSPNVTNETIKIINGDLYYGKTLKAQSSYVGVLNTTLQIFRRPTGIDYISAEMGRFTITNGNTIKLDLIPCYKKSNNEIGFYDIINDVFYTNQGTGTFLKGNNVPNPNYEQPIYSAGDNENLFDKDNEEQFLQNLTPDNNGLIVSAQTSTTSPNYIRTIIIPCKSDANYAITRFLGGKTFFIYESDEYPTLNKQTTLLKRNNDVGKASEIIKTSATAKYLLVKIYNTYASEYYSYDELISSIKIEKGNKATPYSPYGMGSINEKIINKNVWDIDKFKNLYGTNTYETYNNVECLKLAGATQRYNFDGEENTQYTFQFKLIGSTINSEIGAFSLLYSDGTSDYHDGILTPKTYTFTSKANKTLVRIVWNAWNAGNFIYIDKNSMQLEPGTTATPYVPHKEQDYSIFVQQPFRSIGDVRDCFVKKSDGWYERHYIAEGIFNPYNCGLNGGGTTRLRISMWGYQNLKETSVKSKYFPSINGRWDDNNEIKNAIYGWNSDGVIGVNIDKEIASTLDEFKTWASKVGLNFYYIRKNPLDLPCTETQIQQLENLPSTYKDFTYVVSEDETPAYLEVSGIYDLNKLITRTEVLESEV